MRYRDFTLAAGQGTEHAKGRAAAVSLPSQKPGQNSGIRAACEIVALQYVT
jgi:hypothetical protein